MERCSSSAWVGHLAGRFGRRKVLWLTIAVAIVGVGLTVLDRLVTILAEMAVVTAASLGRIQWPAAGSVDVRYSTERRPLRCTCCSTTSGQACLGPPADGSGRGRAWARVAGFVASLFVVALLVAIRLAGLPPLWPEANRPPLPQ
jgi:YNFM family putative membrane transporter